MWTEKFQISITYDGLSLQSMNALPLEFAFAELWRLWLRGNDGQGRSQSLLTLKLKA
jgi:hypothetical protein